MVRRAIFPGTFDPFTIGHESIVRRALSFVDEIVIAVGVNADKRFYFSMEKRVDMIHKYYRNESRVKVASYEGLTLDFAKEVKATIILRGIRAVKDLEYEEVIADVNRKVSGIETVLLFTEPELTYVSSTIVRELLKYNKDISHFIPQGMEI